VVTPVSTTGFEATINPNSTKIPLVQLSTNGSNQIVDGVTNPNLEFVDASSVLESAVSAGVGSVRVVDSRLLGASGTSLTIDFGGTSPEVVSITSNDIDNGIVSFTPNLSSSHRQGAIVRRVVASGGFVKETIDFNDAASPDVAEKLFSGNESKGEALLTSKETFGERDDLNVSNLKHYVDFLAAELRELKWGSPSVGDDSDNRPPTAFTDRQRYFDNAGGVQGARGHTITIGDGTNSFGDFNGTDETVFTAALDFIDPTEGGVIVVKRGTYTLNAPVAINKPVIIRGFGTEATIIEANALTGIAFSLDATSGDRIIFRDLTLVRGSGVQVTSEGVLDIAGEGDFLLDSCKVTGAIVSTAANSSSLKVMNSTLDAGVRAAFGNSILGNQDFQNIELVNCDIAATAIFVGNLTNVIVRDSDFTGTAAFVIESSANNVQVFGGQFNSSFVINAVDAALTGFVLDSCDVSLTTNNTSGSVVSMDATGVVSSNLQFRNLNITLANSAPVETNEAAVWKFAGDQSHQIQEVVIENCRIVPGANNRFVDAVLFAGSLGQEVKIKNNIFTGIQRAVFLGSTGLRGAIQGLNCSGNYFEVAPLTRTTALVVVGDGPGTSASNRDWSIQNNRIEIPDATRSAVTAGVMIESFVNGENLHVSGNRITIASTGDTTNSAVYGIEVDGILEGSIISGNNVRVSREGAAVASAVGIRVDSSNVDGQIITGNKISVSNEAGETGTVTAGIEVARAQFTISGNYVSDVLQTSANVAGVIGGIYVGFNAAGTVSGNTITNVSTAVGVDTDGGIYLQNTRNVNITGNTVFDCRTQFGVGATFTVGDSSRIISVSNNQIRSASSKLLTYAIGCEAISGTSGTISINNNSIVLDESTGFGAIYVSGTAALVNVSGNSIQENVFLDRRNGIHIVDTNAEINIFGNNLHRVQTGSRSTTAIEGKAIRVSSAANVVISSNITNWVDGINADAFSLNVCTPIVVGNRISMSSDTGGFALSLENCGPATYAYNAVNIENGSLLPAAQELEEISTAPVNGAYNGNAPTGSGLNNGIDTP
jgi:hypothetical protein